MDSPTRPNEGIQPVYLRVISSNSVNVILLAAKSNVAPIKPVSLSRLELVLETFEIFLEEKSASNPPVARTPNLRTDF